MKSCSKYANKRVKRQGTAWEMFEIGITNKTLISRIYIKNLYTSKEKDGQLNFFLMDKIFFKWTNEDVQMANELMKSYSTLSVLNALQVKTTMRYHWTPRVGPKPNRTL